MKIRLLLLLSLGSLSALSAQARPYHLTSISWIVATRNKITYDDRYVTIIGHVTRRIAAGEYWFADNTGSVRLDSENFDLPIGPRLMIGGRIDQAYLGFGHIEVDVRKWSYAPVHHAHVVIVPHQAMAPAPTPMTTSTPNVMPPPAPSAPPATPTMTTPETPATNAAPTLAPPTDSTPTTSTATPSTIPPDSTSTTPTPATSSPAPAQPAPSVSTPMAPASTNAAP